MARRFWTGISPRLERHPLECLSFGSALHPLASAAHMPGESKSHSAFVPHDIPAPVAGAAQGPLAGLTAAIKDMYDIVGTRTGGGSPEWLQAHQPATRTAGGVPKPPGARRTSNRQAHCQEIYH